MRIHGWNIAGEIRGKRVGVGAHKTTSLPGGASHMAFRSLDIGLRKNGPLINHIPRRATHQVDLGSIKLGQNYRGHSFTVNQKKAAYVAGGVAAGGLALYGAHKVWQRHQAQHNFNASVRHHNG